MISNAFPELNIVHAFKGIDLNQIKQIYSEILFAVKSYLRYGESIDNKMSAYHRRNAEIGEISG